MRNGYAILAVLILGFAIPACNTAKPQAVPQIESTPTIGATASDSAPAIVESTATKTETPSPSKTATVVTATLLPSQTETPPGVTIPLILTSTPGIAMTLTAVYSTPGAQNTRIAQQTIVAATEAVQIGGLSRSLLSQCPNPSDPPMQNWVNIPVMPQATAGQVVQTLIGSYYCFRAPVTVEEMETFYKEKLPPPGWVMQSDVNGSMVFVSLNPAGMQSLFIVSGPGNKNDLIVAINVSRPISIPTQKP
jgi:hypothetical protein